MINFLSLAIFMLEMLKLSIDAFNACEKRECIKEDDSNVKDRVFCKKKIHVFDSFQLFLDELGKNASQFTLSCFYTNASNI